jgi:hypothetical protein
MTLSLALLQVYASYAVTPATTKRTSQIPQPPDILFSMPDLCYRNAAKVE